MRKAFNFYRSYWEQLKLLNDKQKVEIFNAICSVQFLEVDIDSIKMKDQVSNIVWAGLKHSINSSLEGYVNKQKALGRDEHPPYIAPSGGGSSTPYQQEEEEGKEEVKGKGKGQVKQDIPSFDEFKNYALLKKSNIDINHLKLKYESWAENGWKDGNNNHVKNWKSKLLNTLPHLKISTFANPYANQIPDV
jgi:hypothetical protein